MLVLMNFRRIHIRPDVWDLQSLAWDGDVLVDWVLGMRYPLDGARERINVGSAYRFDAAVGLEKWGVSFEALGTKGRLLRDNGQREGEKEFPLSVEIMREIDRSYYYADDYWYPVTLFRALGERPVIAHCPRDYNILDLEDLDGTCLTPRPKHGAADIFHSRLAASLDGRWLLSNGWVWHPSQMVAVYDVARALEEPAYLSTPGEEVDLGMWGWDVEGATFVGHRVVCISGEEENVMAVYDLDARRGDGIIELDERPGTRLMALDDDHVVLFDVHPRVLQLSTGKIVERWDDLDGGAGLYQPSVDMKPPAPPYLAPDPAHRRFALGTKEGIEVVAMVE